MFHLRLKSLNALLLLPIPFLLCACGGGSDSSAEASRNPLATDEQLAAEKFAISIIRAPAIVAAKGVLKAQWLAAAQKTGGVSDEALTNLDAAIDESVFASALSLSAGNASNPKVISFLAAPHSWYGLDVPGSRTTFDNPDTIYRSIPLNAESNYTITGKVHSQKPVDFNFSLYSATNATLGNLTGEQLVTDADGNFTIHLDPSPSGPGNHITLPASSNSLFVRDTANDWSTQVYNSLSIQRTPAPTEAAPTTDALIASLAAKLQSPTAGAAFAAYNSIGYAQPVNTLPAPSLGGTGGRLANQAASYGAFQLADDEALVLNVKLGGAKYFIAPAYGRWLITTDYVHHTQTLNNAQSVANPDGSYTYVISPKDPGVHNWVDTVGLHQGFLNPRWQGLPANTTDGGPSSSLQLVKLNELRNVLPATTKYVTAAERKAQIDARVASIAPRYAP